VQGVSLPGAQSPFLSVVVPFYNGLDELELTLAGLARQDMPAQHFEVIIAEDGSPISPRKLASSFDTLQVRFVRIDRDGFRLSTARNAALRIAQNIVLLLDFDCVPKPSHLSSHAEVLTRDPLAVTVGLRRFVDGRQLSRGAIESGETWWDSLDDVPSISNRGSAIDKRLGDLDRISDLPFPCNLFHGCNVGFRRGFALEVGLFSERFNGAHGYEDIEFAYRLQRQGARFAAVNSPVFHLENEIVDAYARREGQVRNYAVLSELCPDLVAHRRSLHRPEIAGKRQ